MYTVWADQKYEPAALENQPYLPPYLQEYVRAFSILSTRRQIGMDSLNPIAMTDILAYAEAFETNDLEKFVMYLVIMDAALIKFMREKAESKSISIIPNG